LTVLQPGLPGKCCCVDTQNEVDVGWAESVYSVIIRHSEDGLSKICAGKELPGLREKSDRQSLGGEVTVGQILRGIRDNLNPADINKTI